MLPTMGFRRSRMCPLLMERRDCQDLGDTTKPQATIEENDQEGDEDSDGEQEFSDDEGDVFEGFDEDETLEFNLAVFSNPHGLTSCLFFEKLPVELRLLIYKLLAPTSYEIAAFHQCSQYRILNRNKTAFLRACKQMYNEALSEYYRGSAWPIHHIFPNNSLLFLGHAIKPNHIIVRSRPANFDVVKMLDLKVEVYTIALRRLWWRHYQPYDANPEALGAWRRNMDEEVKIFDMELQRLMHFFHPSNRPCKLEKLSLTFKLGAALRREFVGEECLQAFMNCWKAAAEILCANFEGEIELIVEEIPFQPSIAGNGVVIESVAHGTQPLPTPFNKTVNFRSGVRVDRQNGQGPASQRAWASHTSAIEALGFSEYIFQHLCGEIIPHAEVEKVPSSDENEEGDISGDG